LFHYFSAGPSRSVGGTVVGQRARRDLLARNLDGAQAASAALFVRV
jgi:hypothetical protein